MNEEIMANVTEEVGMETVEAVEEQMVKGSGKGWKIGLGVAAGAGVAYFLYKKVIKPGINKLKAKKEAKKAQSATQQEETYEFDTEDFKLD